MLRRRLENNIHVFFWIFAILLGVFGVVYAFLRGTTTLDINVHDTYFIIADVHMYTAGAMWCVFCGLLYWVIERTKIPLIFSGVIVHLLFTVVGLLSWILPLDILKSILSMKYQDSSFWEAAYVLSTLLFLIGQGVFLLILVLGVFVRIFRKSK